MAVTLPQGDGELGAPRPGEGAELSLVGGHSSP